MYRCYYESPLGLCLLEGDGIYLTRLAFLDQKISGFTEKKHPFFEKVINELNAYFKSELGKFTFLHRQATTTFKAAVYVKLNETQIGSTLSYQQLGKLVNSRAIQAIGTTMKTNNLPIVIPCHRVIKSDKTIGQYNGGIDRKEALLAIERRYRINQKCIKQEFKLVDIQKLVSLNEKFSRIKPVNHIMIIPDLYTCIITQIIYQQIAFKTACRIEEQLYYLCDYEITPEKVKGLSKKVLMINQTKWQYILNVTNFVMQNPELYSQLEKSDDPNFIYETLIKITGVGKWTIEMVLLFNKFNPNIFSINDLIIRKQLADFFPGEEEAEILLKISGIESIVSINLWREFIVKGEKNKN